MKTCAGKPLARGLILCSQCREPGHQNMTKRHTYLIRALLIRALVFCVLPVAISAQWIHYPTAGVPKTPSGAPNLAAKAPRAAHGKPDFSGMWEMKGKPLPSAAI